MVPEAVAELVLPGGLVEGGRRARTARMRSLTGREEEWLAEAQTMPSALKVTEVLSSCLLELDSEPVTHSLVERLLVGDRDYLMLQLRRLTLGDEVAAVVTCPGCGARMDVSFRASEVPVEARPQTAADYTVAAQTAGHPDRTIRFRLPTGADQEAVLSLDMETAEEKLLDACVLDNGGCPLSGEEREMVAAEMERLAPQVALELDLVCPDCAHGFVLPCDTTAFFFDEMSIQGKQLLREIHSLAFYYHWSEGDILGLSRRRRRAYLALLRDALSQD